VTLPTVERGFLDVVFCSMGHPRRRRLQLPPLLAWLALLRAFILAAILAATRPESAFARAIPRDDNDATLDPKTGNPSPNTQAIANTAAFHFGFIEQGGTSLYPTVMLASLQNIS
jgi:hypothetical protein